MCTYASGFALSGNIIFGDFMNVFPTMRGMASALCNFTRLLAMAAMIALSGVLFNGTIIPVALMIAVFCLMTVIAIGFLPKMLIEENSNSSP